MSAPSYEISHLDALESESIHIIREAVAERERPVLLFSGGKDSAVVLHLAVKPFHPAASSLCVPTFHHSRQNPATASRQLDFAFVSASLADRVEVRALNDVADWGSSDHCRVLIDYRL